MRLGVRIGKTPLIIVCLLLFSVEIAYAQATQARIERADRETLAAAVGHFARSRSLLISAIHEFDRGYRLADPSSILDVERFRTSLINRSAELERILDPQPRASESGIVFRPDHRLIGACEAEAGE